MRSKWLSDAHLNNNFSLFNRRYLTHSYTVNTCPFQALAGNEEMEALFTTRFITQTEPLGLRHVLVPMHVNGNHRVMTVLHLRERRVTYVNSLRLPPLQEPVRRVRSWFDLTVRTKYNDEVADDVGVCAWPLWVSPGVPEQDNKYDRGVWVAVYAEFLGRGMTLTAKGTDGAIMRRRLALDLHNRLGVCGVCASV